MGMYSQTEIIKLLNEKGISLFTLSDFGRLLKIHNRNTLYKTAQRLTKEEIIKKLIKGKYSFLFGKTNDFEMANFLYQPSYISLETALSFYGIITGFPYQITSVTPKKTKKIEIEKKEYTYTQISQDLFWGYEKKENFLLADKEKSLLDFFYLSFKGLRIFDSDDFELSQIDKIKIKDYFQMVKNKKFLKFLKKISI